jgi:hypothetical protein
LNSEGSLNLLGLETIRLIYFKNKMAGKKILPLIGWLHGNTISAQARVSSACQGPYSRVCDLSQGQILS